MGDYAFANCTGLMSAVIPEGVASIGEFAFYQCTSLANVSIPASLTTIGANAFYGCHSLTAVSYGGTSAEWDALIAAMESGNDVLKGAEVSYI
jgi:hypothetical protein